MTVTVTHSTPADSSFSSTGAAAWNADHTLTGVGTIAEQNANNVAIIGGTIDGTVIGGTTPAAGTFTTLTATGQTSLGTGSANYLTAVGSAGAPALYTQGSGTNIQMSFSSKGSGNISFQTNGFAQQQMAVAHTASAVNYVQVTGAATGGSPTISSQGSDATAALTLTSKGSANINFQIGGGTRARVNADATVDLAISGSGGIAFKASGVTSQVNYIQATGNTAGSAPTLSSQGTDTNIPILFQSKGTGAIDLAAGSSGVNISNGGTVTAITRTAQGTTYTSAPTVAVSAPTTAGGVQATVSAYLRIYGETLTSGGTGYTVNDIITFVGGTGISTASYRVTSVSAGVVTGISLNTAGGYTTVPSNPISVTGGTGSGATITVTNWGVDSVFTITNAGSGYVEQPTVSFSGGGGSGAAAYATVGSATSVKSLHTNMNFYTPNGSIGFSVTDDGTSTSQGYLQTRGTNSVALNFVLGGSTSNTGVTWVTRGTGAHLFSTNGSPSTTQLAVAHTASAVNYVQVTGAATLSPVQIQAQGSDGNIGIQLKAKGSSAISFWSGGGSYQQFRISNANNAVNNLAVAGTTAGNSPILSSEGSDTNIDLTLTPKGTGNVRFGTYTASMALTVQGYIEIKDSGGTVRKLAVIA